MAICNDNPDAILITEALPKAQRHPIAPALLQVPGYDLRTNFELSTPSPGSSGLRGICIYTSHTLRITDIILGLKPVAVEQLWIDLTLAGNDHLVIGCLYCSPSKAGEAGLELDQLFRKACALSFSHCLIVGDFNLPQINWEDQSSSAPPGHSSHSFIETIQECFLYQHVSHPTRYRLGETANTLDLVFTNEEGTVSNIEYLPGLGASDHVTLKFTLVCYASDSCAHLPRRTHTDYQRLREVLMQCDWTSLDGLTLEDAYTVFIF